MWFELAYLTFKVITLWWLIVFTRKNKVVIAPSLILGFSVFTYVMIAYQEMHLGFNLGVIYLSVGLVFFGALKRVPDGRVWTGVFYALAIPIALFENQLYSLFEPILGTALSAVT